MSDEGLGIINSGSGYKVKIGKDDLLLSQPQAGGRSTGVPRS